MFNFKIIISIFVFFSVMYLLFYVDDMSNNDELQGEIKQGLFLEESKDLRPLIGRIDIEEEGLPLHHDFKVTLPIKNFKTNEYDWLEFGDEVHDWSLYIPQDAASQNLYQFYLKKGHDPNQAAVKVLTLHIDGVEGMQGL